MDGGIVAVNTGWRQAMAQDAVNPLVKHHPG
ncbi:hypothetical protein GA0115255_103491, partial [Streptomyces sp. Ncost-T6T-2b]